MEHSDPVVGWLSQIPHELSEADAAWRVGNAGRGRVASRRAAGMALEAWLAARPREGFGRTCMQHIEALADDAECPVALREAAWRLASRPVPEGGFRVGLPPGLTPMADARAILAWVKGELADVSGAG